MADQTIEVRDADRQKAAEIVKRCGLRDGLFKGARTLNAVETIAYELAAVRAEQREDTQVNAALSRLRETFPMSACSIEHAYRSGLGTPTPNEPEPVGVYECRWTVWVESMPYGEARTLTEAVVTAVRARKES